MIESEGLQNYVDPNYLRAELREATGMTHEEMENAAHELLTSNNYSQAPDQRGPQNRSSTYVRSPLATGLRENRDSQQSYYDGS